MPTASKIYDLLTFSVTYSLVQNCKTTSYFNNATINFVDFSVCSVFMDTLTYLKILDHIYFYKFRYL